MSVREQVLTEAISWVGTPYRHQGRRRGVGCDCLGLVLGVWQALYGRLPEPVGPYAPDWAETGGGEPMLEAAERHFLGRPVREAVAGDVLLFRWRPHLPAKHCGILAPGGQLIHAYEGHAVALTPLGPHWQRRIAAVFAFPNPDDRS